VHRRWRRCPSFWAWRTADTWAPAWTSPAWVCVAGETCAVQTGRWRLLEPTRQHCTCTYNMHWIHPWPQQLSNLSSAWYTPAGVLCPIDNADKLQPRICTSFSHIKGRIEFGKWAKNNKKAKHFWQKVQAAVVYVT